MQNQIEQINYLKTQLKMSVISEYIPFHVIDEYKQTIKKKFRERIYSLEIILQAMLFQAINEDKSEQNVVLYLSEYYSQLQKKLLNQESELTEKYQNQEKRRGRPRKKHLKVQKSKLKEISINTASYDESKKRMPLQLMVKTVESIEIPTKEENLWNGHRVFISDGTNCDTVDNKELREYFMPDGINQKASLPIIKIEGLIDLYSGMIVDLEMDNFSSSESRMLKELYRSVPPGTIIMGDDLYSSYSHMCYSKNRGCDIIAQGKHKRSDKIIKSINSNDCIVEWKIRKRPAWFTDEDYLPPTIQVRRISFKNPRFPKSELYIYTTLLDENKYKANDIIALYLSRWDIEIGFREIKKILKMDHLRGKTVEMVKKEVYAHWIVYNIIRLIMYNASVKNNDNFFSLGEAFQTEYSIYKNKDYNLDKLGRTYIRKSPGRYGNNINKEEKKKEIKQD